MANRVNAVPTEHADVVKGESCKDVDDCSEIDSRKPSSVESTECTSGSKVSLKQNMEGNGDVKSGKSSTAGKSGSGSKSPDNEVFIPAPPPATNAWTKRMQVPRLAKSAGESAIADDSQSTARLPPESNKSAPVQKQSPNPTPTDHSAKSEPQSPRLRLQDSTQTKSTPTSSAGSSKQHLAENVARPQSSSKHKAEVQLKHASEESPKAEAQVKLPSPASDTVPGGCWKKPATAATHVESACDACVVQGSPAAKQHSADQSAGELAVSFGCF